MARNRLQKIHQRAPDIKIKQDRSSCSVPNVPSDSFPFTVGSVNSASSCRKSFSFPNSSAPKYSFKSLVRQPIDTTATKPAQLADAQMRYESDEDSEDAASVSPPQRIPISELPSVRILNRFKFLNPFRARSLSVTDDASSGISSNDLVDTGPKGADPKAEAAKGPGEATSTSSTKSPEQHQEEISKLAAQSKETNMDQATIDHYSTGEAELRQRGIAVENKREDAVGEIIKQFDQMNNRAMAYANRNPDARYHQGRHGLWIYRLNASTGMFPECPAISTCHECIGAIPEDQAKQYYTETAGRYRLCPHYRLVVDSHGFAESLYEYGGSQSCPFCGVPRGTQATLHRRECHFFLPTPNERVTDLTKPDEFATGLSDDEDFKLLRTDPHAFDGKEPQDKRSTPPLPELEFPATESSDDDSDSAEELEYSPTPPPQERTRKPRSPSPVSDDNFNFSDASCSEDDTTPEKRPRAASTKYQAGKPRILDDKDRIANATHFDQVRELLKKSNIAAKSKSHYAYGVRDIKPPSAASRSLIDQLSGAVRSGTVARPFWESNSYITVSRTDFSTDDGHVQRIPDDSLENVTVVRGQLGKANPAASTEDYAGPPRVLPNANQAWFQSRFKADVGAYDGWRNATDGSSDISKLTMDTTGPTHPTTFYTEDTLEQLNWYGDTGRMIVGTTDPPKKKTPDKGDKEQSTKDSSDKVDKKSSEESADKGDKATSKPEDDTGNDKPKKSKPDLGLPTDSNVETVGKAAQPHLEYTEKPKTGKGKGKKKCKHCQKQTGSLGQSRKMVHYGKCWPKWLGDDVPDNDPDKDKDARGDDDRTGKGDKAGVHALISRKPGLVKKVDDSDSEEDSPPSETLENRSFSAQIKEMIEKFEDESDDDKRQSEGKSQEEGEGESENENENEDEESQEEIEEEALENDREGTSSDENVAPTNDEMNNSNVDKEENDEEEEEEEDKVEKNEVEEDKGDESDADEDLVGNEGDEEDGDLVDDKGDEEAGNTREDEEVGDEEKLDESPSKDCGEEDDNTGDREEKSHLSGSKLNKTPKSILKTRQYRTPELALSSSPTSSCHDRTPASSPSPDSRPQKRKRSSASVTILTPLRPIFPEENLVSTHKSKLKSNPFIPSKATKVTAFTKLIDSKISSHNSKDGKKIKVETRTFRRAARGKTPGERVFTEVLESIDEPGQEKIVHNFYRFEKGELLDEFWTKKRKTDNEENKNEVDEDEGDEDISSGKGKSPQPTSPQKRKQSDAEETSESEQKVRKRVKGLEKSTDGGSEVKGRGKSIGTSRPTKNVSFATPVTQDKEKEFRSYRKTPKRAKKNAS